MKETNPGVPPVALLHLEATLSLSTTQLHLVHNSPRQGSPTLYLALLLRDTKLLQSLNRPLAKRRVVKHFKKMNLTGIHTSTWNESKWELVLVGCLVFHLKWPNQPIWVSSEGQLCEADRTDSAEGRRGSYNSVWNQLQAGTGSMWQLSQDKMCGDVVRSYTQPFHALI